MILVNDAIEIVFSAALFVNALLFLPQIIKLVQAKDSKNLSLITFLGFNLIQLAVIAHGVIRKDYLLVGGMALTFIACGSVTFLILFYKK